MRPRERRDSGQNDLFKARLDQIVDTDHGLAKLGRAIVQKKPRASEQDRPDVARRRERWKARQATIDPRRLLFIDETWAKPNMTRTHRRCARGKRLVAKAPFGKWRTLTFLAALRCDRLTALRAFVLHRLIHRPRRAVLHLGLRSAAAIVSGGAGCGPRSSFSHEAARSTTRKL